MNYIYRPKKKPKTGIKNQLKMIHNKRPTIGNRYHISWSYENVEYVLLALTKKGAYLKAPSGRTVHTKINALRAID